tara:strand:+ start:1074 stop:1385 length:312 start_codon:yes stop_codon:yes gene_type:complete
MLLAEHREIKRIPNAVAKGTANITNIPEKFCLGTGHVKFFYDKLEYLLCRYYLVHYGCLVRGFNVQDYSGAWDGVPKHLMGSYQPTEDDKQLIRDRISERLST